MRHTLREEQWERFRERLTEVFQSRFQVPFL